MKYLFSLITGLLGFSLASVCLAAQPQMIGWIEHVQIASPGQSKDSSAGITLKAKIDTGADNSSVHAEQLNIYQKDGDDWVKFSVKNLLGEQVDFDLPVTRYTMIKRRGVEAIKRPVVRMPICLGNTLRKVDINLANRENFKYRMLIGRSYLQDSLLVNSVRKFTTEPGCKIDKFANL